MEPYFLKLAKEHEKKNKNIIIRNDNIIFRILSRPSAKAIRKIMNNSDISVFSVKEISPKTINTIEYLSKYAPNTKIYIGTSPVIDAAKRAFKGEGIIVDGTLNRIRESIDAAYMGLLGKLTGKDYYSPGADIVAIRSDIPVFAAHEIGHAVDFNKHKRSKKYYDLMGSSIHNIIDREIKANEFAIKHLKLKDKDLKLLNLALNTYAPMEMEIKKTKSNKK